MNTIYVPLILFLSLSLLVTVSFLLYKKQKRLIAKLIEDNEVMQKRLYGDLSLSIKSAVHESSLEAFSRTTESVTQVANQKLTSDRELISQELKHNKDKLDTKLSEITGYLQKTIENLNVSDKEKGIQLAKLSSLITTTQTQTQNLIENTASLTSILSGSQTRGQLGERIADDVLRLAGFIEGVNYEKQKAFSGGNRPDFTFLLPKGKILNMDVKFPVQNYSRYLESQDKEQRNKYQKQFLLDVKTAYKTLLDREYIEVEESLDCMIVFIPHEEIFAFIQKEDASIFDFGLKNKIITCSPMTLFAVLSVIRKSVEQFTIEKTSYDILTQISSFRKQWDMFQKGLQTMGKRIDDLKSDYDKLTSTRGRLMDKQFEKFDKIQQNTEYH